MSSTMSREYLHSFIWQTHFLETRAKVLPVPAVSGIVELGASKPRPLVIVVFGSTIQKLTIDGGSPSNSHTKNDGGSTVFDADDRR